MSLTLRLVWNEANNVGGLVLEAEKAPGTRAWALAETGCRTTGIGCEKVCGVSLWAGCGGPWALSSL